MTHGEEEQFRDALDRAFAKAAAEFDAAAAARTRGAATYLGAVYTTDRDDDARRETEAALARMVRDHRDRRAG